MRVWNRPILAPFCTAVAAIGVMACLSLQSATSTNEVANSAIDSNDGPASATGQLNLNRTRFTDPAVLIQNKNVQEHLDLNEVTREAVLQIPILIRQASIADHQAIAKMKDGSEREKKKQEVRRRTLAEGIKALEKALTPEQHKRILQLALQVSDFQAFEREDVKERLKLTAEQQQRLDKIASAGKKAVAAVVYGEKLDGGGNLEGMWQKSKPARKKAMRESLAVLDADQKNRWNDMVGEPFDFALERPGKDLLPRVELPAATAAEKADPLWVKKKIDEWMPQGKDKNFDQIGWLTKLREATRLAKEHNRGVYIFVVDGVLGTGRC